MTISFSAIEPDIASLITLAIEVSDIILNRDQLEMAENLEKIQSMQTIALRLQDMMGELSTMKDNKLDRETKRVMDIVEKNGK